MDRRLPARAPHGNWDTADTCRFAGSRKNPVRARVVSYPCVVFNQPGSSAGQSVVRSAPQASGAWTKRRKAAAPRRRRRVRENGRGARARLLTDHALTVGSGTWHRITANRTTIGKRADYRRRSWQPATFAGRARAIYIARTCCRGRSGGEPGIGEKGWGACSPASELPFRADRRKRIQRVSPRPRDIAPSCCDAQR